MYDQLHELVDRHHRPALAAVLVGLLALAVGNRFVQDDAYISFRYAENLVEGYGLVYNPGERVEGYTNFLWTLLIAGGIAVGCDPVVFSQVLGLACFAATLLLAYRLAEDLLGSRPLALLVVVLLGANYTMSAYATGGLETQLQATLCTAAVWLTLRLVRQSATGRGPLLALGLVTAAALLNRLDSAVFLFVLWPVAAVSVWRRAGAIGKRIADAAWLTLPPLLIVGAWLLWKLSYYGDVLPNTFYAKTGLPGAAVKGLHYVFAFLAAYWLLPLVVLGLLAVARLPRNWRFDVPVLVATVGLWTAYVIRVGGDFMEFRFFVPVLPLIFTLIAWTLVETLRRPELRAALVVMLLSASVRHAWTYEGRGIESIAKLEGHLTNPSENWEGIGRRLGELFGDSDQVVMATYAAGAIPYHAKLPTVDMFGLNDRWVARHGIATGSRTGHFREAPLEYLIRRRVSLAVGAPLVTPRDPAGEVIPWIAESAKRLRHRLANAELPPHARLIEIPLDPEYKLTVLYLTPSPRVDEAIRRHGLKTLPLGAL